METISFAIIMEWENVLLTEKKRIYLVLKKLQEQIHQLRSLSEENSDIPELEFLLKLNKEKVNWIITYNKEWGENAIRDAVESVIGRDNTDIVLSLIPTNENKYFELKNLGAKHANADIFVFLDGDVIPQENWLVNLLSSFADPKKEVVAGNTFVDHETLYQKSYALVKFNLPAESKAIIEISNFFVNNMAMRREVFEKFNFPATETTFKVPSFEYPRILIDNGIKVFMNLGAQGQHPVPLPKNFFKRAFYHGRDEMIDRQKLRSGDRKAPLVKGKATFWGKREMLIACERLSRVFKNRKRVGLPLVAVPFAYVMVASYYAVTLFGYVFTYLFPKYSRENFDYIKMADH